jgi:phosphotransacetylase
MREMIENRTFDEIQVGDSASLEKELTHRDIKLFAVMSGDVNPAHVDEEYARDSRFHEVVAHGMWGGSMISTILGTQLPGPGTVYLSQFLRFLKPIGVGDRVLATVRVREKNGGKDRITLDCRVTNDDGEVVIDGTAEVLAPTEKITRPRWALPEILLQEHPHFEKYLHAARARARDTAPLPTAVVHPVDTASLAGALTSAGEGLIRPILVGPEQKIRSSAEEAGLDLAGIEVVNTKHSHEAAEKAVELVRQGVAEALMKGSLHTDELMKPILDKTTGLRTGRRMSHVFAFDVPSHGRPLFITDAALNISPGLEHKADIVRNAIDLGKALAIDVPKVAILSAVETVAPQITSTLDAAALCKMADRRQITGGVLDGPLAFDNAISVAAAAIKGIESPVAGQADILVVPDLEAGNMLAKQLEYLAGAEGAGIVLGARVPVILTSRADNTATRLASSALAVLWRQYQTRGES